MSSHARRQVAEFVPRRCKVHGYKVQVVGTVTGPAIVRAVETRPWAVAPQPTLIAQT